MNKPQLDPKIMNTMQSWGNNYDSTVGNKHNAVADKIDSQINSKEITLNTMSNMDASHAKPSNKNPGVDTAFLNKSKPQSDTTGHGKLSRSLKD